MPRPTPRPTRPQSSKKPPEEAAFELALRALARRERTSAQIRDWLDGRGFEPEVVAEVVERLQEAGGLDDARFARLYAEDRRELDGWGAERISAALAARGVDQGLIDETVGAEDETDRATALLADRGQPLGDDAARGRAHAFLVRRGYSSEVAYAAVRAAEKLAA